MPRILERGVMVASLALCVHVAAAAAQTQLVDLRDMTPKEHREQVFVLAAPQSLAVEPASHRDTFGVIGNRDVMQTARLGSGNHFFKRRHAFSAACLIWPVRLAVSPGASFPTGSLDPNGCRFAWWPCSSSRC